MDHFDGVTKGVIMCLSIQHTSSPISPIIYPFFHLFFIHCLVPENGSSNLISFVSNSSQSAWRNIPEDLNIHQQTCENLISYLFKNCKTLTGYWCLYVSPWYLDSLSRCFFCLKNQDFKTSKTISVFTYSRES